MHSISISFMNYDMIIIWHIYVPIECIAHVLWDMSILAGLRLTTYVCVVSTKGKHISNAWWDVQCGCVFGRWGLHNLTTYRFPHMFCKMFWFMLFFLSLLLARLYFAFILLLTSLSLLMFWYVIILSGGFLKY